MHLETHTTQLRKVGGSIMMAVPPSFITLLDLQAGAAVGISIEGDKLLVKPKPKPRYNLSELLAASDYSQPLSNEDREWINAPAVGRELL